MSADDPDRSDRQQLVRWQDEIDFRDLIYGMAESVSEAQVELDRNLAATMVEFAQTTVDVVPRVVRTVRPDGTVVTEPEQPEKRSLLDLGLTPTRYQFSEATVDVEFDLSFVVDETGDETRKARFRIDTSEAHHRRRYHGEADTTAKVSARLVPVPTPAALSPATVEPGSDSTTGTDGDVDTGADASGGADTESRDNDDGTEGGANTTDETDETDETGETSDHTTDRPVDDA